MKNLKIVAAAILFYGLTIFGQSGYGGPLSLHLRLPSLVHVVVARIVMVAAPFLLKVAVCQRDLLAPRVVAGHLRIQAEMNAAEGILRSGPERIGPWLLRIEPAPAGTGAPNLDKALKA